MGDVVMRAEVKVLRSGVVATLKSSPVAGWVADQTRRAAGRANSRALARRDGLPASVRSDMHARGDFDRAPYEGEVKSGRYTPYGVVRAVTADGDWDQNQNHTLDNVGR